MFPVAHVNAADECVDEGDDYDEHDEREDEYVDHGTLSSCRERPSMWFVVYRGALLQSIRLYVQRKLFVIVFPLCLAIDIRYSIDRRRAYLYKIVEGI